MPLIPTPERPFASFDFEDIARGVVLTPFYCYASKDSSSTTYKMSPDLIHSGVTAIRDSIDAGSLGTNTYTFDSIPFNLPRIINGEVTFSFDLAVRGPSGGTSTAQCTIKLFHWDGSSATQLGTTFTTEELIAAAATVETEMQAANFTVTNQKFKIGEQVRIELAIIRTGTTGSGNEREVGIDPQNKDGVRLTPSTDGQVTTQSVLYIPFKMN